LTNQSSDGAPGEKATTARQRMTKGGKCQSIDLVSAFRIP
jgi:hypothetical protein